jgi:hypothetical protein
VTERLGPVDAVGERQYDVSKVPVVDTRSRGLFIDSMDGREVTD